MTKSACLPKPWRRQALGKTAFNSGKMFYARNFDELLSLLQSFHSVRPQRFKAIRPTPDPLTEERQILGGGKIDMESLLLLEARLPVARREFSVAGHSGG
jgi:hypothetical protein